MNFSSSFGTLTCYAPLDSAIELCHCGRLVGYNLLQVDRTMDPADPAKFFLQYPELPIDTGSSAAGLLSEKDQKLFQAF